MQGSGDVDAVRARVLIPELKTEIKNCYVTIKTQKTKIDELEKEFSESKIGKNLCHPIYLDVLLLISNGLHGQIFLVDPC